MRGQTDVAQALGISTSAMSYWMKKYRATADQSDLDRDAELVELRKENKQLAMENDILKKATAIFSIG